jgi:hypothetical protein
LLQSLTTGHVPPLVATGSANENIGPNRSEVTGEPFCVRHIQLSIVVVLYGPFAQQAIHQGELLVR